MELHMEKRCISAYVENQIGVLEPAETEVPKKPVISG